jgi:hypothetical protein
MKITPLKPSISGLYNLALGFFIASNAFNLALKGNRSPNFWIQTIASIVVIGSGLYILFVAGKGKLEKQTSQGWAYFCFGAAIFTVVFIGGNIISNGAPLIAGICLAASATIWAFLGYHLWPKK